MSTLDVVCQLGSKLDVADGVYPATVTGHNTLIMYAEGKTINLTTVSVLGVNLCTVIVSDGVPQVLLKGIHYVNQKHDSK